ncbi:hypothetical protein [Paraburkholderia phenoliruptrix]|uniref:hypothetical protein n=1 Tax=Paraburkholderia phenoliruptrix TaxID=252970 RepID=UPI002869D8A8|nr:hypothetical protein [Paraburkholderia phenoliruptrix]WMY09547.1 hypothetical protein P3F88_07220 [Paraburkholderia phenoliruptrix]
MKIVINSDVGVFRLSEAAAREYLKMIGQNSADDASIAALSHQLARNFELRSDPALVKLVEEMGPCASGDNACLQVVDVPATGWHLLDVCGIECVVHDVNAQKDA